MFDRLDQLEARYNDLSQQMSDPTLVQDQKKYQAIAKAHRDRKSTRLNSSHRSLSRMPSSA